MLDTYKINFTNVVRNDDGTYNFDEAETSLDNSFEDVVTQSCTNVDLGDDALAGLLERCSSNVEVHVNAVFFGRGRAGVTETTSEETVSENPSEPVSETVETPIETPVETPIENTVEDTTTQTEVSA